MRVSDKVLKSTVFLGLKNGEDFRPKATAFFVSHLYGDGYFLFLVTCQHVVQGRALYPRLNTMNGGCDVLPIIRPEQWHYHPDSDRRFVDVAVTLIGFNIGYFDTSHIPLADFCTAQVIADRDVGIGDELFYPSLFTYHAGKGRNLPVMRGATLAGMPIEPIITNSGPINAYLIEGRSIGGHSGSPVFVNFLAPRSYYADKAVALPHPAQSQAYRLLGIVRGFIRADELGEYVADDSAGIKGTWVNSGISIIIPASEIAETILQPDLIKMMEDVTAEAKR